MRQASSRARSTSSALCTWGTREHPRRTCGREARPTGGMLSRRVSVPARGSRASLRAAPGRPRPAPGRGRRDRPRRRRRGPRSPGRTGCSPRRRRGVRPRFRPARRPCRLRTRLRPRARAPPTPPDAPCAEGARPAGPMASRGGGARRLGAPFRAPSCIYRPRPSKRSSFGRSLSLSSTARRARSGRKRPGCSCPRGR